MRLVIAGVICLAATVSVAGGPQSPSGKWLSDPSPSSGDVVIEFFDDGTALIATIDDGRMKDSFAVTVKSTDKPKKFELRFNTGEGGPMFEMKSEKLALLHGGPGGIVIRMVRNDSSK